MATIETPRSETYLNKTRILYHVLDPSADTESILGRQVPVTTIPRRHLYGTQTRHEYERKKRSSIMHSCEQDPEYLDRHPILVCAVPVSQICESNAREIIPGNMYKLAVLDGHHRSRFGHQNNPDIPGRIMTIHEGVELTQHRGDNLVAQYRSLGDNADEIFYRLLNGWMSETLRSFADDANRPDLAPHVSTLERATDGTIIIL